MKRLFVLLVGILMLLALTACGGNTPMETTHTHNYEATVTAPTCTAPGYTLNTCTCGDSFISDYVEAFFHDYQESSRVEATVSENGVATYNCIFCGDSYEKVLYATGSLGVEYEANRDGTYTVVGLGTCTDLDVVIPQTYQGSRVTAIGAKAFAEKSAIISIHIPDSVTSIGNRAFYGCSGITEITIPASVTSIGTQIFYKCDSLHTVYYNSEYVSYTNPFLNVTSIKKVVFGGKRMPAEICRGCSNIEEVVIGGSITSIPNIAFSGCISLTSITIPDSVTSIGAMAFSDCSSLTSITIPDSVTSIGPVAFGGCTSLMSIIIPDSVTSIGYEAFRDCSSLTSITIPDSVTRIAQLTFSDCYRLTSIIYTGPMAQWKRIALDYGWNRNIPAKQVTCSDGTVSI